MADDCGSVDSETSRLSDLTESEEGIKEANRNSSSEDSSSNLDKSMPHTDSKTECSTQEVFDSGGTQDGKTDNSEPANLAETSKLTADTVSNELVIGSDLNVLNNKNVREVTGALGVPTIGNEMETLVSDCMKEGSDSSKDGMADEELDLTGIDDAEINKVNIV